MLDWLRIVVSIVFIDLILSSDNALVIGVVAANLPVELRWIAFVVGGGGAVILRILLTYIITLLLHIPLLRAVGGALLLLITVLLLLSSNPAREARTGDAPGWLSRALLRQKNNIILSMLSLLLADVLTSFDNVIAVAALTKDGPPFLLVVGLLLSVLLLLVGSALLSRIIRNWPWLLLIATVVLTITAAHMIAQDSVQLASSPAWSIWWNVIIYLAAFAVVSVPGYTWCRNYFKR
jgi:YjbE family integral membrane protein